MPETTKNGYFVEHGTRNPYAPKTKTSLVDDIAKNQALSQTLVNTPDKDALGYPAFSTVTAYTAGQIVYYQNKLWKFAADKAAGAWDSTKVTQTSVKEEAGEATKKRLDDIMDGTTPVPIAETLKAWADQKALAKTNIWTESKVRTTAGNIPAETSEGSKPLSIKPTSDWTAKLLFNGSYNMLKAAVWGHDASQYGVGSLNPEHTECYFLVPKLTLGAFGTAAENNGLLFTDSEGNNIIPTSVKFQPLASGAPSSSSDGTTVTPTSVTYNGKTYAVYECSGEGWFYVVFGNNLTVDDVCAHIAWEDWYDKYVGLDEEDDPTDPDYNPEAALGILMLEGFLAGGHVDKKLYYINDDVRDWVEFGDTSATIHIVADIKTTVAGDWNNTEVETGVYLHTASVGNLMKTNGAAVLLDGTEVVVEGTTVSFSDSNSAVSGDKLSIKYEKATEATVTEAYSDTDYFAGSNIDTATGKLNINDCSIEAQVDASGTAEVTTKYALNIVDAVAINASVNVPELQEAIVNHEERIEDLEDTAVRTGSYDASVAVGLADNLRGDTVVDAEFYKRKTGGTQSVGSGIAAIKEVRGKSLVWNQLLKEGKLVDMGLPSGTLWASCNIDITQEDGFAASPFQYECSFFSWGNVDGHNPTSTTTFDYDFGGINAQEPWYEGQPYGDTQGNTLTGNIPVGDTYDAARVNVGALWRMPAYTEVFELTNNIKYINADGTEIPSTTTNKIVDVNGVMGLYMESKINGARLFFPCSGIGIGHSWNSKGTRGSYWFSDWSSAKNAKNMGFVSSGVFVGGNNERYIGFALRPVIKKSDIIELGKLGHKYAISSNNKNIFDATLMFGAGNEPATVADFEKMFPLDYYDYNAGEVIPFAGQNLTTTGKNQYNPATGKANLLGGQTYQLLGTYTGATIDEVAVTLDSNNCFTTTKDCLLEITGGNDEDTFVGLYNGETSTYEPYEKHTLPLDPSQWRDKQGNLVFPYGGMHGVGTAYDYAKVDADGYIRKVVRCFGQVDLGTLTWTASTVGRKYCDEYPSNMALAVGLSISNAICAKYVCGTASDTSNNPANNQNKLGIPTASTNRLCVADQNYSGAATFKSAMSGVMLNYELAEPVEVELATPVYAKYLVDKDGTEEITPANGQEPYTTPANLSILYAMDARGTISNLPKNYLSKESAENMLNAMVSAGVIASYTMTWDAANSRYAFTIVAPA